MQQSPQTQCPYEIYHGHCYNLVTNLFLGVSLEKVYYYMTPIKDIALYYIWVTFRGRPVLLHKDTKLLLHVCKITAGVTLA